MDRLFRNAHFLLIIIAVGPSCAPVTAQESTASLTVFPTSIDLRGPQAKQQIIVTGTRDGRAVDLIPTGAEAVARCTPVYETLPGWKESTVGARSFAALPENARSYLARIEALTGVPIAMVSTGPDRDETILVHHPFS